jgi:hypothetical protein
MYMTLDAPSEGTLDCTVALHSQCQISTLQGTPQTGMKGAARRLIRGPLGPLDIMIPPHQKHALGLNLCMGAWL